MGFCSLTLILVEPCAFLIFCPPWNYHHDNFDCSDQYYDSHLSTVKPTSVTSCLYSLLSQSWIINLPNFPLTTPKGYQVFLANKSWPSKEQRIGKPSTREEKLLFLNCLTNSNSCSTVIWETSRWENGRSGWLKVHEAVSTIAKDLSDSREK